MQIPIDSLKIDIKNQNKILNIFNRILQIDMVTNLFT